MLRIVVQNNYFNIKEQPDRNVNQQLFKPKTKAIQLQVYSQRTKSAKDNVQYVI